MKKNINNSNINNSNKRNRYKDKDIMGLNKSIIGNRRIKSRIISREILRIVLEGMRISTTIKGWMIFRIIRRSIRIRK